MNAAVIIAILVYRLLPLKRVNAMLQKIANGSYTLKLPERGGYEFRELARNIVLSYGQVDGSEWQNMKNRIKDELHRYIFDKIKRNPMILPIIMEI